MASRAEGVLPRGLSDGFLSSWSLRHWCYWQLRGSSPAVSAEKRAIHGTQAEHYNDGRCKASKRVPDANHIYAYGARIFILQRTLDFWTTYSDAKCPATSRCP